MNKEELLKKTASLIGVSSTEKELALEVLSEKISALLKSDGAAIKIDDLGVFQRKDNGQKTELIFSPVSAKNSKSDTMFLRLPVSGHIDDSSDDLFSISVGKPIVPLSISEESDSSYIFIKKRIEERVSEILNNAKYLSNFNLWDEYLKTAEPEDSGEIDDSALIESLTIPDEPEEDEPDSWSEQQLKDNLEFYTVPEEKEEDENIDDEILEELTKNEEILEQNDDNEIDEDDEVFSGASFDTEESEVDIDLETFRNLSDSESDEQDDLIAHEEPEELETTEPDEETIKKVFQEEEIIEKEAEEEVDSFNIDNSIFKEPADDDKLDWSWGDELEKTIEEIPQPQDLEIEKPKKKNNRPIEKEEFEPDPFGKLQKTLEDDYEFRALTGEHEFPVEEDKPVDEEFRVTNLDRPRPIPPKPTRMTRLTQQEMETDYQPTKTSSYESLRERRQSGSNIFVISGIIIILLVIIYFAFSMGDEPSKEILQPTRTENQEAVPPVTNEAATEQSNALSEQPNSPVETRVSSSQPTANRNNSEVEEVRVSNLIFRRGNTYNVQVSSWRSSIKAQEEVNRLRAKGHNAFVVQAYLPTKGGTWHRVRIGGFKSVDEARNFLNNVQL